MIYGRRPRAGYVIRDKQTGRQVWVPPIINPTGKDRRLITPGEERVKLYTLLMLLAIHALVAISSCHNTLPTPR